MNLKSSSLRLSALAAAIALTLAAPAASAADRLNLSGLQSASTHDRFIVKYRSDSEARANAAALRRSLDAAARAVPARGAAGFSLQSLRRLAVGADVVKAGRKLNRGEAESLMRQLATDPDVEYVELDQLLQAVATPNDPRYNEQWHYYEATGGIKANEAWDVTTGSGVVVAVIDTGITPHADLNGNIVAGYDFISDTAVAQDGDGRDSNPNDPGDWFTNSACGPAPAPPSANSSWHGTHVAGTVAAVANNSQGVVGVAYGAKVMPVRVLGRCGGLTSDISDAIIWASGGAVAGVPGNTNPAEVINMSLGGQESCSNTNQSAITGAVQRGTVVVVAAGNSGADVSGFNPASCNGVIAVAATDRQGARSVWSASQSSNYGALIDVAAPGSDILSTYNSGTQGQGAATYAGNGGTSMAAPHVAGVAALIQAAAAAAPKTPAQIEALLKSSARAFPGASTCAGICGAGIVNAKAAVDAVAVPPPPPSTLSNGVGVAVSGTIGTTRSFTMVVPAGATGLKFVTAGGTGDVDVYAKFGSAPTTSVADCKSEGPATAETCSIATAQAGTYHVLLSAYSTYSGATLTGSYTAGGNTPPVANFSAVGNGLTVTFTDSSTDSNGSIASRSWNFGDGTTSTATHPSKTYAAAGTYNVTLTVTDNAGATHSKTSSVTVTSGANTPPVANFSASVNGLTATFTDSSTDSNGSIASRSWNFGDGTTSTATHPSKTYAAAGTYNVTLTVTDNGGATHSKTSSVTVTGGGNVLSNGVPKTGISGALNSQQFYTLVVPAGATGLKFVTSGGTGDADLYVRFGSQPTTTSHDCKSEGETTAETCNIATAQAGTYHVLLSGYSAYSGLSLTGSYIADGGSGGTPQTYSNTTDVVIGDYATVDSPLTVSGRSGNAPATASVSVNIVHTWIGQLKVDLVAPDGSLYNIHNRSGTSADNIVKTVTLNLSTELLNGTWKLRVNDNGTGDTGYINSWSVRF